MQITETKIVDIKILIPNFLYIISSVDDIDTCSQFPDLECSYACRQQGHNSTSGICFCESGQKLESDGKTCVGNCLIYQGFHFLRTTDHIHTL